jgi:hypothetical protein
LSTKQLICGQTGVQVGRLEHGIKLHQVAGWKQRNSLTGKETNFD